MFNFFLKKDKKNTFVFFIGFFSLIQVQILGTFGISEFIAILLFPFIKPFSQITDYRIKNLLKFLFLGILGIIISDIYNETSIENSIKGVFFLIIFFIEIPVVYWLLKEDYKRIFYFILGGALSSIVSYFFFPSIAFQSMQEMTGVDLDELMSVWFVYSIQPICLFFASLLYFKNFKKISMLLIISFAFYALFGGSRNIFLVWSLVAILMFLINKRNKKQLSSKRKLSPIIILLLLISIMGTKIIYENLAENGSLGVAAQTKYLYQKKDSGDLGLLSGRIDFILALKAIYENPFFGYGSYASDKTNISLRGYKEFGIDSSNILNNNDIRVPSHSHILGAYVNGGILGIFFWMYALNLIIKFLKRHLYYSPEMIGLFLLLIFSWIWDFLFSPFANRLHETFLLVSIVLVSIASEKKINK